MVSVCDASIEFDQSTKFPITPHQMIKGIVTIQVNRNFDTSGAQVVLDGDVYTDVDKDLSGQNDCEHHHMIYESISIIRPTNSVSLSEGQTHTYDFAFLMPEKSVCYNETLIPKNKGFHGEHIYEYLPSSFSFENRSHAGRISYSIKLIIDIIGKRRNFIFEQPFEFKGYIKPMDDMSVLIKSKVPVKLMKKKKSTISNNNSNLSIDSKKTFLNKLFGPRDEVEYVNIKTTLKLQNTVLQPGEKLKNFEINIICDTGPDYFKNQDGSSNELGLLYLESFRLLSFLILDMKARNSDGIATYKDFLIDYDKEKLLQLKCQVIDLANLIPVEDPRLSPYNYMMRIFPEKVLLADIEAISLDFEPNFLCCTIDNYYCITSELKFKKNKGDFSKKALISTHPISIVDEVEEQLPSYSESK